MNWKDIEGYEGLYQVSDTGEVMNVKRNRMLKAIEKKSGYLCVCLYKDGIKKWYRVHRLVADAFLPNPLNLPCVNHKIEGGEGKKINTVENLEWCTYKYNTNYGTCIKRMVEKKINGKKAKAVLQFSLDGTFIKEFPSAREVERQLGFFQSHISDCCRGNTRLKTYKGYIWKYKEVI